MKQKKIIFRLCLIVIFICAFIFCAFYNGLIIRKYVVNTAGSDKNQTVRIVLITDLHSHIYGEAQKDLVELIKKQKPDIIALAGDIADDNVPIEGTKLFLEGIKGHAPVYYVSGNHEFWSENMESIKKTIQEYGVKVLENSFEEIEIRGTKLIIGGVDDPDIVMYQKQAFNWLEAMKNAFAPLQKRTEFKILLSHRPELVEIYKECSFDLVLSGHAHGGQVRIPFLLNGLLAPNQGWFPKYAGGLYKYSSFTHIVSRGVSFNPRLPRIFNPPEVVVIDVKGIATR